MNKFRYIYGFLILIILVGGIYIAQITNIWDPENVTNNSDEEVATGLKTPTGKYTLGEIIKGYDLDKKEFYEALKLPMDYPEDNKVINIVRLGDISYADITKYMGPILEQYGKQKSH